MLKKLGVDGWALLLLVALHIYADSLFVSVLNLTLTDNYHLSNYLTFLTLGLLRIVDGTYVFLFGNFLSVWPTEGPLLALVYGNVMQCTFVACFAATSLAFLAAPLPAWVAAGLLFLALLLFSGGEALGSMSTKLTIGALRDTIYQRDGKEVADSVQSTLFNWLYGLGNVAIALGASFTTLGWRVYFTETDIPSANVACIITALLAWIVVTILAYRLHRRFAERMPDTYPPRPEKIALVFDERHSYQELWARHVERLKDPGLQLWLIVIGIVMFGVFFLFMTQALILPKYLIWRHEQVQWFGIFTAINPLLITVLVPFVPLLLGSTRGCCKRRNAQLLVLLCIGTTLQATAPLWEYGLSSLTGTTAFLVQFTLGEALAMPQLNDYQLRLVGRDLLPYSQALMQVPLVVATPLQNTLSSTLLDTFCASETSCPPGGASTIWLVCTLLALTTPIGFGALWLIETCQQQQQQEDTEPEQRKLRERRTQYDRL